MAPGDGMAKSLDPRYNGGIAPAGGGSSKKKSGGRRRGSGRGGGGGGGGRGGGGGGGGGGGNRRNSKGGGRGGGGKGDRRNSGKGGKDLRGNQFSAMTLPSWLGRAVRNRYSHAIEQTSHRWRGGRREDSARTRRKILISTQVRARAATTAAATTRARTARSSSRPSPRRSC